MDERYWAAVIDLMRRGVAHAIALDMAFDVLDLRDHSAVIARQRRNEADSFSNAAMKWATGVADRAKRKRAKQAAAE